MNQMPSSTRRFLSVKVRSLSPQGASRKMNLGSKKSKGPSAQLPEHAPCGLDDQTPHFRPVLSRLPLCNRSTVQKCGETVWSVDMIS